MSLLPSRGPETSTRQDGEFEVVGVDEDVAPVLDALASDTARDVLNQIYDDPGTPSEIADRLDMSIQKVAYHLEKLEDVDLITVAGTRYSEKGQEMSVYEPPDDPLVLFVGTEDGKSRLRSLVKRVVPAIGALAFGSLFVQHLFGSDSLLPFGGGGGSTDSPGGYTSSGNGDGGGGTTDVMTDGSGGGSDGGNVGIQSVETPTESAGGETAEAMATSTPAPKTETAVEAAQATPTGEPTTTEVAGAGTERAIRTVAQTADPGIEPGVAFFLGGVFALAVVGAWWYYRSN